MNLINLYEWKKKHAFFQVLDLTGIEPVIGYQKFQNHVQSLKEENKCGKENVPVLRK
jgi:hypothetical protein